MTMTGGYRDSGLGGFSQVFDRSTDEDCALGPGVDHSGYPLCCKEHRGTP
ncbi:predicted protein [Plenodomus lingam JN3]|uniref:Predicted protein n=1 Tax=Leptosphaeria maculans (strain JN3 / isolate v23.1.3 / race Av1-4-5-6-7-8) TaxID=985895 RepID=E5AAP7_LEPMJ|nr:predicted protein [Plenodomus lingam JN3]CBY00738.1 predicted protein [Plenodomus lingam JN3]